MFFFGKRQFMFGTKKDQTEFLPLTCRTFPRRFIQFPESKFTSCSFLCPEIGRLVLLNKKSQNFYLIQKQQIKSICLNLIITMRKIKT